MVAYCVKQRLLKADDLNDRHAPVNRICAAGGTIYIFDSTLKREFNNYYLFHVHNHRQVFDLGSNLCNLFTVNTEARHIQGQMVLK